MAKYVETRMCFCNDLGCRFRPIGNHDLGTWLCPSKGNGNKGTMLYKVDTRSTKNKTDGGANSEGTST